MSPKVRARYLCGLTLALSAFICMPAGQVFSQDSTEYENGEDLTDDVSRADLFERIRSETLAEDPSADDTKWFNLWGPFAFPNDAIFDIAEGKKRTDSFFVADISHYTDLAIPLDSFAEKKIRAVYVKASQKKGRDSKFVAFWKALGDLDGAQRVHRGAYHFLSAKFSAADQCKFFSDILDTNKLRATDLPPVVDFEWDIRKVNGPDAWEGMPPKEMVKALVDCLEVVEQQTGRKPIVYTAVSFLNDRHIDKNAYAPLAKYKVWIADYSKKSRASEVPRTLGDMKAPLWQFTDKAKLAVGFSKGFDASIFKGSEDAFYEELDVERFK